MKPTLSLLVLLALCCSLFACGRSDVPPAADDPTPPPAETPVEPPVEPPVQEPAQDPAPPAEPPSTAPSLLVDETSYVHQILGSDDPTPIITAQFLLPEVAEMPQVTAYYQSIKDDLLTIYSAEAGDALMQLQDMGEGFAPWAMEMTFEVLRNDGTVLSILREVYENRNGVHPAVVYHAETYQVASQGRLLLGNLFTVPESEYLPRLRDLILTQMDQRETQQGIPYYENARADLMTIFDPMDFALTEDSLLLFYDVYALAPYVAGPQQFSFPLTDLSDILQSWVTE